MKVVASTLRYTTRKLPVTALLNTKRHHNFPPCIKPPKKVNTAGISTVGAVNEVLPAVMSKSVHFIGGGRMAECIINGTLKNHNVSVIEINSERREYLEETFGTGADQERATNQKIGDQSHQSAHLENPEFKTLSYEELKARNEEAISKLETADAIVLAVKPQNVSQLFRTFQQMDLVKHLEDTLILSVCAGVSLETLRKGFQAEKIVRAMPNTPAMIGKGLTVWLGTDAVIESEDDLKLVENLLGGIGKQIRVTEEEHIDMATAISGSGPGYVFLFLEAMIESAVHCKLYSHFVLLFCAV